MFFLLGTVMAVSCMCQYKRSKRNCCRVGNEETLTDNDFLGEILVKGQDSDIELKTFSVTEQTGGSSSDPGDIRINCEQDSATHESPESLNEETVEVQMHRNGSAIHSTE